MVRAGTVRDDVGFGLPPVVSHSGLAGRLACLFAVAVLLCVSSAQGQVIEEGGFPVKGGGVSGESFSLSCPPRLVVEAGESVALSCSATAVPEEGVRYGWESVSGEGFYLLSASDELSPLFTAPLSGAGEEYAYRLTAMAAGVYRTATVTVSVEGVPGETVRAPVVREECDSFTVPDELGEGCVEDKGPSPFGFGSEAEGGFLFPEAPGLPDRPSGPVRGGGSVMQAPPRLECPAAVFLEELETSVIECRVFDASGEENLEYSWEPVGNTTRDYLENPRLIPEDSPTPSVVAPEAPAYETLESFRSVETTFRYRYRLTATSRATGLSSHSEVEVFVSGSRPGVYCPLEVEVAEGESIVLDCEGVDPLSGRMDYDEDGASIEWEWEGLWGTSTSLLDATDRSSPLFTAPAGSAGEEYHYVASMTSQASGVSRTARRRVTVRVAGEGEGRAMADASALAYKEGAPVVTCEDSEIYEATADFTLGCTVANPPSDATYRWTARGGTSNTSLLTAGKDGLTPTFAVPDNVDANTDYEYTVTLSASGVADVTGNVTVTVKKKNKLSCLAGSRGISISGTFEGINEGDIQGIEIDVCDRITGDPGPFSYSWSIIGATASGGLHRLSNTNQRYTTFTPPHHFDAERYEYVYLTNVYRGSALYYYKLTISSPSANPLRLAAGVWVFETTLTCRDSVVYEGSPDFDLNCSITSQFNSTEYIPVYGYTWSARGDTPNTDLLIDGVDELAPTFAVPEEVAAPTTYEYRLTVEGNGGTLHQETVTVTVLNKGALALACADPSPVYEGAADFDLDCSATGAPAGSTYDYVWAARGDTPDTALLIAGIDSPTPTFDVPENVDANTDYEYTLTVSAGEDTKDGAFDVTVTVLDRPAIVVTCPGNPYGPYEGADDITLDCSATGAPSGSDYDYVWTERGSTANTDLLVSGTDGPTPTFDVPENVDANTDYEYTLTVSAGEDTKDGAFDVTVTVLDRPAIVVTCPGNPYGPYEGADDIVLDCEATGGPSGSTYDYAWTERGGTADTDKLSSATIRNPAFDVPESVDSDEPYYYTLTVSAENAEDGAFDVTVTVLDKPSITVTCPGNPYSKYEGEEDFDLDCSATGAPEDSDYVYAWTPRGGTANTDLLIAGTDGPTPTFDVPESVDSNEPYEYLLTVSAENAESATAPVTVRVLNRATLALVCTPVTPVYEGSPDFDLNCAASGAPAGSTYDYVWTARGSTVVPGQLSSTTVANPTFDVPEEVSSDTDYEYTLTVSAENAEDAAEDVTVTVLNKKALNVACATPSPVYEGSEDFALDCAATGAPAGSDYAYVWTARGGTANTDLLVSGTDGPTPTFDVPEEVDEDKTYEYLLRVSAENAIDATAEVTVKVLKIGSIALVCASPPLVYEGSADFELVCSVSGDTGDADYTYVWTARGAILNTARLSATDIPSPTFAVPDRLDATTTYEYLLTASAANAIDATAEVTVTVLNRGTLAVACAPPALVYEGAEDFDLDCTASGAPSGSEYAYAWTARGDTPDTALLISGTNGPTPTFSAPAALDATTTYEYLLTVSAEHAESGSAEVTVTVLNKGALAVVCADPSPAYEGAADFDLDCSASGAPAGSTYAYVWTARDDTPDTALLIAGIDGPTPTFAVPDEVDATTTYEYLLTASAEHAESGSAEVTVTVLNHGALGVVCVDPPSVYEGSADFDLNCSASGAPGDNPEYTYAWEARGDTPDTALLISGTNGPTPTFAVPSNVDATTTYEYLLTASAEHAESGSAEVTVTVLNKGALAVVCADPSPAYEGAADFDLDCSASGAPAGSEYAYVWTARDDTPDTALLIAGIDGPTPTFAVPDEVAATTTYEYLLTVSAENAESGSAEVTVTVLNHGALGVVCVDPPSVYEGSADFDLNCSASGAPGDNPEYTYAWEARGDTPDTALLISGTNGPTPTFSAPAALDATTTYEYLLTVSAEHAESGSAEVTVTVLNKGALAVVCADPSPAYEGAADFDLDCSASGAPAGSDYAYAWTARGGTANTDLLSATDGPAPTFDVPDALDETTTYEYLLTASAENAEDASAEVTVTVLNKEALALACADPGSVYEGSADFSFDCTASGAPEGSDYEYAWTARGDTQDTSLLSATDGPAPTFAVPDDVSEDETYEYLLTVSAANAEDAAAEVAVTVLDRVLPPVADSSPRATESSAPGLSEASSLGVTASASSLRFGVQSAETQVSLDPMTDQISTRVSGPYHAGRMTLSPGSSEEVDENGPMDLSIELVSPVVLRREGGVEAASIVISPQWSLAESCEQLSSQTIGGLYTEVTLSDADCRLLRFGGELDLTDVLPGEYAGSMDVVLRSGESEETHSVEVDVTVVPAQRVITIGPGGVRFSTSRELSAGLTEEQNLSIYPDVAFLTEGKPHGAFELSNPSLIPLEVSVSARFGYTEATADGREVVVEDTSGSHLGDLSQVVDIRPGVLVLMPGEKGLVRYGVKEGALAAMEEKGYAAFFDVASEPRQYVRTDRMPEEVTGDRTARVTMRIPGVYVPGEGASQLRATLVSISFVGSPSATFLVETEDRPFAGEVVAYDGDGRELGRRETLVYTRSRVRIPLDRIPEEDAVFLRFAPRGSGRVPEPAAVEWDAPRRDIGAAQDKKQTPGSAAIAGKP